MENQIGFKSCFKLVYYQLKVERKLLCVWLLSEDIRIYTIIYNKMIQLYAIINEEHTMEIYVRNSQNRRQMQAIIKHALKIIKKQNSKVIKSTKIGNYTIYYFRQATFIFILGTIIENRIQRMQNYLRVVADIFYQTYDQKKFHYILDRIMDEINKTQFGIKKQNTTLQDQQSSLVNSNVLQEKIKLSSLIEKRQRQSIRAYIIMTILFLGIVVLAGSYLVKKWS